MTARPAGPVGLGGWLWPVTWLSALMPALLLPLIVDMVWRFLTGLDDWPWAERPVEMQWEYAKGMVFGAISGTVAFWWASQWFARSPRVRTWGPVVLAVAALVLGALLLPHRDDPLVVALLVTGGCTVALAWWAAYRSLRVRHTFVDGAVPVRGAGFANVLRHGPGDWSALRWLVPGVLAYAALRLVLEASWSLDAVLHPYIASDELVAIGSGASLHDPTRYILASRTALVLQLAAMLALVAAGVALARGSKWMPVLTVSALLLALGAAVRMAVRDWCCPFVDGPPFESHVMMWLSALVVAGIGAIAWRRPRATPHAE